MDTDWIFDADLRRLALKDADGGRDADNRELNGLKRIYICVDIFGSVRTIFDVNYIYANNWFVLD